MAYNPYNSNSNNNGNQPQYQQQAYSPQVYVPSVYVPGQGSAPSAPPPGPSYGVPVQGAYAPPNSSQAASSTRVPDFSQALDAPPPQYHNEKNNYHHNNNGPPSHPTVTGSYVGNSHHGDNNQHDNYSYPEKNNYSHPEKNMNQYQNYPGNSNNYHEGNNKYGSNQPTPTAVAHHVTSNYHDHSTVYNGGPTNGLVSEGNPTKCHKVDYEIKGHEMQLVEIELDAGETVVAEAGAMMFLDDNIDFKAKFGDGSNPGQGFFGKVFAAGGRILTGESLFLTHFTNKGSNRARVAFAAPFPGSGLFGGEGFVLQKLEGDGMAFIHAGGTVMKRELRGDRVRVDTGCLVAFTEGIKYDITFVPGLKSIIFGGEGLFLATLQGHGTVWMQSLPFSRMADRILQNAPSVGGGRKDEGSALTGKFGDIVGGNGGGNLGGLGGLQQLQQLTNLRF